MLSHQTKAGAPWCPWRDVLEGGMEMLDIISDIAAWCLAGRGRIYRPGCRSSAAICTAAGGEPEPGLALHLGRGRTLVNKVNKNIQCEWTMENAH